jgi:glycosyltransferase involved in cell wall biosynthesis
MADVVFLVQAQAAPSTRVRVTNLFPELQRSGKVTPQIRAIPSGFGQRLRLFRGLGGFAVVVLQKKLLAPLELAALRRHARCLIFDFDDAIYLRDLKGVVDGVTSARRWRSLSRSLKFSWIIRHCDAVLAGNDYLAAAARRAAGRRKLPVEILPSAVPVTGVPQRGEFPENAPLVVGWVGSSGNLGFVAMLGSALAAAAEKRPFVLHVLCDEMLAIPGVHCTHLPWRLDTQEREIARFDIGIMPLPDTPWTRGKCSYKLLQYMAAGVPFVASAVGMNIEAANTGPTGLLAETAPAFTDQLLRLLAGGQLRRDLGRRGRQVAEVRYSTQAVAERLAGLLARWATTPPLTARAPP